VIVNIKARTNIPGPAMFGSPRLKELAEDQTPLYRVLQDPKQCNFTELIATLIGGDTQIEVAEAITAIYPNNNGLRSLKDEIT
jgi:hypothetical protein